MHPTNKLLRKKHLESCKSVSEIAVQGVMELAAQEIIQASKEMECVICMERVMDKADSRYQVAQQ